MTKSKATILIILSVILLLIAGGLYFLYSFFSAFAPPKVTITKTGITTNQDFINGVTIEKINVDSMSNDGYPIKYTVTYATSCIIQHSGNKPPNPPDKIQFYEPGKYFWDEDTIQIRYELMGLGRHPLEKTSEPWWLNKFGKHPVCPLKFEPEQWYLFTIGDPQVTGIFFYIDSTGKEHQYFLPSGISPI